MIDITCEMCMDLMPLVHDGIASEDSARAVHQHVQSCAGCRTLFEGELPPPSDGQNVMKLIKHRIHIFSAMALMFGILFGISLTAGSGLFYNIIIMPLIGAVGYYIFRWSALYAVPGLLLVSHLIVNGLGLIRGAEYLNFSSLLIWTALYCLFSLVGTVIAGLLHFALRKER